MRQFLLEGVAIVIVGAILSLVAWLVLSGIVSFAGLDWIAITATPRGRMVYAVISLAIVVKAWAWVTGAAPARGGMGGSR